MSAVRLALHVSRCSLQSACAAILFCACTCDTFVGLACVRVFCAVQMYAEILSVTSPVCIDITAIVLTSVLVKCDVVQTELL